MAIKHNEAVDPLLTSLYAQEMVALQVGGDTFTCSTKNGTSGQLLRLVEKSDDSEYVVLIPAPVAKILQEVLESAVGCLHGHAR